MIDSERAVSEHVIGTLLRVAPRPRMAANVSTSVGSYTTPIKVSSPRVAAMEIE